VSRLYSTDYSYISKQTGLYYSQAYSFSLLSRESSSPGSTSSSRVLSALSLRELPVPVVEFGESRYSQLSCLPVD
jgi:hypothetical protein